MDFIDFPQVFQRLDGILDSKSCVCMRLASNWSLQEFSDFPDFPEFPEFQVSLTAGWTLPSTRWGPG